MSTLTKDLATTRAPEPPSLPRKRWTLAEFDRLLAEGFLVEGDRAYLWDGEIIEPMAENPPHINAVANLTRLLLLALPPARFTVNQGAPITLAEGFRPQPDFSILNGPRASFRDRLPGAADVALLIEVADSTRAKDFGPFLRKYAEAGIPRYWVVDIPGRRVEVFDDPGTTAEGEPSYRRRRAYGMDEAVPLVFDGGDEAGGFGAVAVRDILQDSLDSTRQGDAT